ncbi:MAG TPA: ATP-binding protein [Candidatus Dormibacteraeota bacterium]|nr:ATP-binding protein [Candidatus Dormibacteraeota bacterium]
MIDAASSVAEALDAGEADPRGYARAILNILEDASFERAQLEATQRAVMNILDDAAAERAVLAETQRAAVNILEDFDAEKKKVEQANVDLRSENTERARAERALRRATAAAEAANKELEAFSYSVAHDLRAPLRSIAGFSQALQEDHSDILDEEATRFLRHIREAAQQMGELIDDLLNLSRVTRAELRRENVDLSEIGRAVIRRLQEAEPDRAVHVTIAPGLDASADRSLAEVVLTNLLGNAWKFTGKTPQAEIELGAELGEDPPVFFVRDNGAGFDQRYADKLFGVFQRLHTAAEFEGTGIGLATVQRIVLRHGGRASAEGALGRGAIFRFTLDEARP